MNSTSKICRQFLKIAKINVVYFRNSALIKEHGSVLNQQTLTGRFLLFFNNLQNTETLIEKCNQLYHMDDVEQLHTLSNIDLCNYLNSINDGVLNRNIFNYLDMECCRRLSQLGPDEIFSILRGYMKLAPQYVADSHFFNRGIGQVLKTIDKLEKDNFLQFLFYASLKKKSIDIQNVLRRCFRLMSNDFIKNLKTEELCIICNSAFRTSTKITNVHFLNAIVSHLNNNLIILKDPALFITLIKTIRHNRYQTDDLLKTISCTIFFNKTLITYTFPALCHILALYADYLYYDNVLLDVFSKKSIELLRDSIYISKNEHLTDQPRLKDIKRFLWALSNLNRKLTIEDIETVILPKVHERTDEIKEDPGSIAEIMLYLWMQNYRAYSLVPIIFDDHNLKLIRDKKSKSRERLNLLLHCISLEDPELYKTLKQKAVDNPTYPITKQLKKRPFLQKLLKILKITDTEINHFELACEIPNLNIAGVVGYRKDQQKSVYLEILDETNCLKNYPGPSGLMTLKLRLLDKFDQALIVIAKDDVESLSNIELQKYLIDEIKLLC